MKNEYKILLIVFLDDTNKKYAYYTDDLTIQIGDQFKSSRDGRLVRVVDAYKSDKTIFNGKPLNKINKMEKSKMIDGIKEKYMSQYIPERVSNAKMSADGAICVLIGNEYVGIKGEELTTYPEEFVIDIPVYSISKPQSQVQVGEIVISGKSFGKVISKNPDGSLKILSFSGYTHNKKEVKDFLLGQATVRVLVNYFNQTSDFNPIMFAALSGDKLDIKTLAMMQMMPGMKDKGNNNPMMDLFKNPMMMAMMMKGDSSEGNLLESMMLMGMMGGNNPFSSPQPQAPLTTTSSPTEDIMKILLEEDPEFNKAFAKAIKKRSKKGGDE